MRLEVLVGRIGPVKVMVGISAGVGLVGTGRSGRSGVEGQYRERGK